jgi:hypothetical protein
MTNLVRVRDPCTGLLLVSIRNPKIDINPYTSGAALIDMHEALDKQQVPIFNREQPPINFDSRRLGWHIMLELIKKKEAKA